MKKLLLLCVFIIVNSVFLMAQDIDAMVKNAVDGLALRVITPINTSIGGIYLEGTVTPSALSRYLANKIKTYASDTGKFDLLPLAHSNVTFGPGAPQKGLIKGSFRQTGGMVNVTLQLVGDPGGQIIESRNFSIPESYLKENGIDVLPANAGTREEVMELERVFALPSSQQTASALQFEVWPDSDTGTYFAGDKMMIYLFANRDCYVRMDYVDASGKWQLLYPDRNNRNNIIRANQLQALPRTPVELIPALGMERIWVRVSTEPFNIGENEFTDVKAATRNTVAASRAASEGAVETAEAFFSITKLPDTFFDETWSYRTNNMYETIETIHENSVQQNGSFSGNSREGSFTTTGTTGIYRVSEDIITVSLRYTSNQLLAPVTRGDDRFDFPKPINMPQAVRNAETIVISTGGTFKGDEYKGDFVGKHVLGTVTGSYTVNDKVYVFILKKPLFATIDMIRRIIMEFFGVF